MTIHVMTSSKGGMGKTMISLAIALYCISTDKRFVLIDTNPQNSNLAEDIFSFFHATGSPKKGEIISSNKIDYTLSPSSEKRFTVYDATDHDPFGLARKIQEKDDSDTVFIIDTNVHIRSAPSGLFNRGNSNHCVYTWFLWGWSSPRLDHQLDAVLSATNRLEEGWPHSQVIHVFNIYDYFVGGLGIGLRKASKTLKPLKRVLKLLEKRLKRYGDGKCKGVYIDMETLGNIAADLHSDLARYVADDDVDMEELPNLWAKHLKEMIMAAGNDFPFNILLIPTFFKELTMSTDRLIMSSARSFKTIRRQIRPMADFVDVFLNILDKCTTTDIKCNT